MKNGGIILADKKPKEKKESKLSIVGSAADLIKNNLEKQIEQFSWKITFPKDELSVSNIPREDVMLLNSELQLVSCEFIYNEKENSVLISPNYKYKVKTNYFFVAKYKVKNKVFDTCIAFYLNENNVMNAYDKHTSKEMINETNRRLKAEAARRDTKEKGKENEKEPAPK